MDQDRKLKMIRVFLIILTETGILAAVLTVLMLTGVTDRIALAGAAAQETAESPLEGFEAIPTWDGSVALQQNDAAGGGQSGKIGHGADSGAADAGVGSANRETGDPGSADAQPDYGDAESTEGSETQAASYDPIVVKDRVVFVGDSRTVGMYYAVTGRSGEPEGGATDKNGDIWAAKIGMGYEWMKSTGVPCVESYITDKTAVVIAMGVNDVGADYGAADYREYLNRKAADWTSRGAFVYYVSVNPVKAPVSTVTNEGIEAWNEAMLEGLSEDVTYIDINTQMEGKFDYTDSLHYTNATNLQIYELIKMTLAYT